MRRTTSVMRTGGAGLALALALTVILSGCGGGRSSMPVGQNFTPNQGGRFVIAKGDLPSDFKKVSSETRSVPCDSGWLANRGALTETANELAVKQQLLALGPQSCHLSVYQSTRRDSAGEMIAVTGFQVFAVVFPDPTPASMALPLFRTQFSDRYLAESYAEGGETPARPRIAVIILVPALSRSVIGEIPQLVVLPRKWDRVLLRQ